MSILFALVTFLLFCTVGYMRSQRREAVVAGRRPEAMAPPRAPRMVRPPQMAREGVFEAPKGYCFHPGHTWAFDEGRLNARVGMDSLAASLIGKIDRIEVARMNRWIRQGQKAWTVTHNRLTVDMLSPVEGVVVAVNPKVLENPNLVTKDPYAEGWILQIQSPELATNLNNLIQGSLVWPWMQNSLDRLAALASPMPGTVPDGGPPVAGILAQVEPDLQRRLVKEFFLTQ